MVPTTDISLSALIAAEVRPRLGKLHPGQVLAIRLLGGDGHSIDALEVDDRKVRVAYCASNIAIRRELALRDEAEDLVILTDREPQDLEDDLLARFVGRRLLRLDPWHAVAQLFKVPADGIDSRLRKKAWMASLLIEKAPADGYAAAPGGLLTVERAYQEVLRSSFMLDEGRPDLVALLRWGRDAEARRALAETAPELRQDLIEWMVESAGATATPMLRLMLGRRGEEALAFGLAMEVLAHDSADGTPVHQSALIRLEVPLGGWTLSAAELKAWSGAARVVFDESDDEQRGKALQGAEKVLDELKAGELAESSDLLPSGLEARRRRLAKAIEKLVKKPEGENLLRLDKTLREVETHALHSAAAHGAELPRMALRLARWLVQTPATAEGAYLGDLARAEYEEAGFVELAVERLSVGDESKSLVAAYKMLLGAVAERRDRTALVFGRRFAEATALGKLPEGLIGVEQVIDRLVSPIAAGSPVLLLVLDGAACSVMAALGREIETADYSFCELEAGGLPLALAAIPSLTEVSRSSLLRGRLQPGKQADEKGAFAKHAGLVGVSKKGKDPILFHKKDLQDEGSQHLAKVVREALSDGAQRVVGLVINAVDDHLMKGNQVPVAWSLDQILHLRAVLSCARDAGRVVILASDHGHLLDRDLEKLGQPGENARWRQALGDEPKEGEVLIRGPRVLTPGNKALALASTRKRYAGMPQNGYHGGVSPQEIVIPLAILAPNSPPPVGLKEIGFSVPAFWLIEDELPAEPKQIIVKAKVPDDFLPFDEMIEVVEVESKDGRETSWIGELIASDLYREQEKRWKRMAPPTDRVQVALEALVGRGGKLTAEALARALNMPLPRLPGFTSAVQRVLNLDGVMVFGFDPASSSYALDEKLAREQFLG